MLCKLSNFRHTAKGDKSVKEKQKSFFNTIIKPALVLATVALIVSAALVIVYNITKQPEGALDESVVTAAQTILNSDVETVDVNLERFAEFNVEGIVRSTASNDVAVYLWTKGYGGELKAVVGINESSEVIGVQITSMMETAGLGDRTKEPEFLEQYVGKTAGVEAVKSGADGNQIDAISGATISSKAVTANVNNALSVYEQIKSEVISGE